MNVKIRWLVGFSCPGRTGDSASSKSFKPGDICLATAAKDFLEIDGVRCMEPKLGKDFELVHETKSDEGKSRAGTGPEDELEKAPTWTGATRPYGGESRK